MVIDMKRIISAIVLYTLTMMDPPSVAADGSGGWAELLYLEEYYEDWENQPNFEEKSYRETADWLIDLIEEKYTKSYRISGERRCHFLFNSRQRILEIGPPERGGRFIHEDLVTVNDLDDCNDHDIRITIKTMIHLADAEIIDYVEYDEYDFRGSGRLFLEDSHNPLLLICDDKIGCNHDDLPDLGCIEGSIQYFHKNKEETIWKLHEEIDLEHYIVPVIRIPDNHLHARWVERALNHLVELAKAKRE